MHFKDSRTYQNLIKAFEWEMMECTRYSIYADKARDEGFNQIGSIYDETSSNEKEHAIIWYRLLNDGDEPSTLDNIKKSIEYESYEWLKMYVEFANTAKEEGFQDIASIFEGVGNIEKHHDYRFNSLVQNIQNNKVFCKNKKVLWVCVKCGNLIWADCAPGTCTVCGNSQGYYELNCENY